MFGQSVHVFFVDTTQKTYVELKRSELGNKPKGKLETMARISMIVCDLCKEEIKEDDTAYAIVLSSYVNGNKNSESQENGEICRNCHRSLVIRLNKSPTDLLRASQMALTFPNKPINPQKPAQFLDCFGIELGATGQNFGKSAAVGLSESQINSETAQQLAEGEFKVKSRAHLIERLPPPKCNHDKKSFGDDGKFICLLCDEILGAV